MVALVLTILYFELPACFRFISVFLGVRPLLKFANIYSQRAVFINCMQRRSWIGRMNYQ